MTKADRRPQPQASLGCSRVAVKPDGCFEVVDAAVEVTVLNVTNMLEAWMLFAIAPASFWLGQMADWPAHPHTPNGSVSLWA